MARSGRLLALLALLLAALPVRADESPLARALASFRAGRFAEVPEICKTVPVDNPDHAKARYLSAEAHLVLGQTSEAEAAFREVLARNPEAIPAKIGLGRALSRLDRHEEALAGLRAVVRRAPRDVQALRALGEALSAAGRTAEAGRALTKAWRLDPKDPLSGRALAELCVARGDVPRARSVARRLAKSLPDHPMGPFLLGLALDREGEHDEAIRAYEAALERDDTFLDAHKNLAILCHTQNPGYGDAVRTKKALRHYERYFALGGRDEDLRRVYGQLRGFLGSAGGAR